MTNESIGTLFWRFIKRVIPIIWCEVVKEVEDEEIQVERKE